MASKCNDFASEVCCLKTTALGRDIEVGEELFLDYGVNFFINNDQTPDPSTPPLSLNENDENENESELRPMEDIEYIEYMADTTGRFIMNDSSDETYEGDGSGSGTS